MWDAVEVVSFVWTVIILMYTVIAVALIIGRWAFNRIRQALHEGALLDSAHQPHQQNAR
jgi:hypothetical protein